MPVQTVVFATKLHQGLSDEIVKYAHSQVHILPLKCGRIQRFHRELVGKSHNLITSKLA